MSRMVEMACLSLCVAGLAGGCGSSRTAAATQSTAKTFDVAKSDPKAVAIADQVVAALGGEENWNKAHEIVWSQGLIIDGKLQDVAKHAWDRWNGRHQFTRYFGDGGQAVAMYEIFGGASFGFTHTDKGTFSQLKSDKEAAVKEARRRLDVDSYFLTMPFKLKDPGVILAYDHEEPDLDAKTNDAPMKYDLIKITFEPGVGPAPGDTWYLSVDKESHMPGWIERRAAGKAENERSGFRLADWQEAGGLKFATRRETLGYTKSDAPKQQLAIPPVWQGMVPFEAMPVPVPGELILIRGLEVHATPNDDLYVPNVNVSM